MSDSPTDYRPALILDHILGIHVSVLDHGFARVVDVMGDDTSIVQAARVSYGAGTKTVTDDRGLIRYLMRHLHNSPFEACEIKLHIKAPIFVARQWVRHRTASWNEVSARYSEVSDEFYVPDGEAICEQSVKDKQGRSEPINVADAVMYLDMIDDHSERSYDLYQVLMGKEPDDDNFLKEEFGRLIKNHPGIARELARIVLPVSTYTEWYWKVDLHNLLHFLKLRCDRHAQMEIRAYADVIADIVQRWVPWTHEAWVDYRRDAVTLSRAELEVLRQVIRDDPHLQVRMKGTVALRDNLTCREKKEFLKAMDVL